MTHKAEILADLWELVCRYDVDSHKVGNDLLGHHYYDFWYNVRAFLIELRKE